MTIAAPAYMTRIRNQIRTAEAKADERLLAKLDDIGKQKLRAAQRAWVAFRDAQAEFEADDMRDGSAAPLLHSGSRARNTRDRTAALKEHLKELESR